MTIAKYIKYGIHAILAMPAYIAVFKVGKSNAEFIDDLHIWQARTPCPFKSLFWVFTFLMAGYPPFRNITYFRLKRAKRGKFYRYIMPVQQDIYLACEEELGGGFYISHGYGTTINAQKIGKNFHAFQGVTLGQKDGGIPTIGDNVTIYAGAKVIGKVIIGDNVEIGANAVVLHDVPSNSIAVGIPAVIKSKKI